MNSFYCKKKGDDFFARYSRAMHPAVASMFFFVGVVAVFCFYLSFYSFHCNNNFIWFFLKKVGNLELARKLYEGGFAVSTRETNVHRARKNPG